MPNNFVDGMDVLAVRQAALEAMELIRSGVVGPYFLEVMTYRFRGHSMGDPERYRKAEEVKRWQENDPIGAYRKHLIDNGIASDAELDAVDARAEAETLAAVQFAESSPEPAPEELFSNVYVDFKAY
jgi:pyruvate dehydrogenase E1 component alpha subunit